MLTFLLRLRRARADAQAVQRKSEAIGKRATGHGAHRLVHRIFR